MTPRPFKQAYALIAVCWLCTTAVIVSIVANEGSAWWSLLLIVPAGISIPFPGYEFAGEPDQREVER